MEILPLVSVNVTGVDNASMSFLNNALKTIRDKSNGSFEITSAADAVLEGISTSNSVNLVLYRAHDNQLKLGNWSSTTLNTKVERAKEFNNILTKCDNVTKFLSFVEIKTGVCQFESVGEGTVKICSHDEPYNNERGTRTIIASIIRKELNDSQIKNIDQHIIQCVDKVSPFTSVTISETLSKAIEKIKNGVGFISSSAHIVLYYRELNGTVQLRLGLWGRDGMDNYLKCTNRKASDYNAPSLNAFKNRIQLYFQNNNKQQNHGTDINPNQLQGQNLSGKQPIEPRGNESNVAERQDAVRRGCIGNATEVSQSQTKPIVCQGTISSQY